MNSEIDYLIKMALADGEVTEKERAIILKKAETLGLDVDEVEMILDGEIAIMKKEQTKPLKSQSVSENKSNKEGDVKKCPSCGADVASFSVKCHDCGHEFRNTESSNATKEFYTIFNNIELEERKRSEGIIENWYTSGTKQFQLNTAIANRQISLISTYPIPNTKEDILEFLSLAVPEAIKKLYWAARLPNTISTYKGDLRRAYFAKCEQIIMKARFAMKEDKKTLEEVEFYAKQLGIK